MNRFLRSALFPVVVITLIVWLGTQTLMGHKKSTASRTTSEAIALNPVTIREVVFSPTKHQAQVSLNDGTKKEDCGSFGVVSLDTTKSGNIHAIQFQLTPSDLRLAIVYCSK